MRKAFGVLAAIGGLAAFVVAMETRFTVPGVIVAVICFFLGATAIGRGAEHHASLRPFVGKAVDVEVWGVPLEAGETQFVIDSVATFGAGLLIHLRTDASGRRSLLKVAQPGTARVLDGRFEIERVGGYVSWGGTKIKRPAESAAPAVVLRISQ